MLLEAWRSHETAAGVSEAERATAVAAVEAKLPKRVKRKRPLTTADGLQVRGVKGRRGSVHKWGGGIALCFGWGGVTGYRACV